MIGCSHCGKPQVFARGYCQGCYSRLRRRGTLERANVVNSGKCMMEGCDREAFAKNLCGLHYSKNKHPLWNIWKLMRSRNPGMVCERWQVVETFAEDVGPKPSDRHRLVRLDPLGMFEPGNLVWKSSVHKERAKDSMTKEERRAYARDWQVASKYGLLPDEYKKMREDHEDLCAICGEPETVASRTGGKRELAVDHDHLTKKPRGLLCCKCNTMIGRRGANDSIPRLRAAIAYLEKHQSG